jgi:hypothetical protein
MLEVIFLVSEDDLKLSMIMLLSLKTNSAEGVPSRSCEGAYNWVPAAPVEEKISSYFLSANLFAFTFHLKTGVVAESWAKTANGANRMNSTNNLNFIITLDFN